MLRSGVILLVLGIAVFLAASVQLFRGGTKKVHWCISCVLAILLVGSGIWNANRYFDLGIGVPKTFCGKLGENRTEPAAFHGQRPAGQHRTCRHERRRGA